MIKGRLHTFYVCLCTTNVIWRILYVTTSSFIHSIGMCRIRRFLAVLRSFFHSSLLYTLFFHPFPPTSLPSSLTSSCHLFLDLPLSLVLSKLGGILFSSILCTCPNQRNLFSLIVSVIMVYLTISYISLLVNISKFLLHYHILGLKFFYTPQVRRLRYLIFQKKSIANIF